MLITTSGIAPDRQSEVAAAIADAIRKLNGNVPEGFTHEPHSTQPGWMIQLPKTNGDLQCPITALLPEIGFAVAEFADGIQITVRGNHNGHDATTYLNRI